VDLSGIWTLVLRGHAAVVTLADPAIKGITLGVASYEPASNRMMLPVTIAKGKYPAVVNLLVLNFTGTRANASAANNTGFTDLQLLMPGSGNRGTSLAAAEMLATSTSPAPAAQLFSDNWAALLKPFDHTRWMGATGTNSYSWLCGGANAAGCSVITWGDRNLPSYAFTDERLCAGCHGVPWEHVLLAANELGQDVWINVRQSLGVAAYAGWNRLCTWLALLAYALG